MNNLRPVHLAVLAAFVAGVFVTLGVSSVLGGNDDDSEPQAVAAATSTSEPATATVAAASATPATATASTTVTPATATPGVAPPPGAPTAVNPTIGTGAANPGVCTNNVAAAYLSKASPALQAFGSGYVAWQASVIPTTSEEMTVLKQILAPFISTWEANAPIPDGCVFIHNRVLTAAKTLTETANRAPINNTPALGAAWDAEYNGRTGEMKAALDQYFQVTATSVSPRPFP